MNRCSVLWVAEGIEVTDADGTAGGDNGLNRLRCIAALQTSLVSMSSINRNKKTYILQYIHYSRKILHFSSSVFWGPRVTQ